MLFRSINDWRHLYLRLYILYTISFEIANNIWINQKKLKKVANATFFALNIQFHRFV